MVYRFVALMKMYTCTTTRPRSISSNSSFDGWCAVQAISPHSLIVISLTWFFMMQGYCDSRAWSPSASSDGFSTWTIFSAISTRRDWRFVDSTLLTMWCWCFESGSSIWWLTNHSLPVKLGRARFSQCVCVCNKVWLLYQALWDTVVQTLVRFVNLFFISCSELRSTQHQFQLVTRESCFGFYSWSSLPAELPAQSTLNSLFLSRLGTTQTQPAQTCPARRVATSTHHFPRCVVSRVRQSDPLGLIPHEISALKCTCLRFWRFLQVNAHSYISRDLREELSILRPRRLQFSSLWNPLYLWGTPPHTFSWSFSTRFIMFRCVGILVKRNATATDWTTFRIISQKVNGSSKTRIVQLWRIDCCV
jgi:hypothetical protein